MSGIMHSEAYYWQRFSFNVASLFILVTFFYVFNVFKILILTFLHLCFVAFITFHPLIDQSLNLANYENASVLNS